MLDAEQERAEQQSTWKTRTQKALAAIHSCRELYYKKNTQAYYYTLIKMPSVCSSTVAFSSRQKYPVD